MAGRELGRVQGKGALQPPPLTHPAARHDELPVRLLRAPCAVAAHAPLLQHCAALLLKISRGAPAPVQFRFIARRAISPIQAVKSLALMTQHAGLQGRTCIMPRPFSCQTCNLTTFRQSRAWDLVFSMHQRAPTNVSFLRSCEFACMHGDGRRHAFAVTGKACDGTQQAAGMPQGAAASGTRLMAQANCASTEKACSMSCRSLSVGTCSSYTVSSCAPI